MKYRREWRLPGNPVLVRNGDNERKAEVLSDQGIGFEMGTNPVFLILAWQQKLRIVVYLHRVNS